jgi:hypothetical protein
MFQRVTVVQSGLVLPRSPKAIPQAGVSPLYTISGGRVRVLSLFGEVTTLIAGGANNAKVQYKPTGQTAIDLCAVADINAQAVGQVASVIGPAATPLAVGWGAQSGTTDWLLGPGTIDLNCVNAAGTGAYKWTLVYEGYPGAMVVAA